jgi:N-acetylmuramoyl-L-alanine amidase
MEKFNGPHQNARLVPFIIIHGTAVDAPTTHAIFKGETDSEVSAHFVIDECGKLTQYVDVANRAWHAGKSYWAGLTDLNSLSIGIELVADVINNPQGFDAATYTEAQYEALVALLQPLVLAHKIKPQHILGHQDIAPTRKTDPGFQFDWALLAKHGLGLWHGLNLLADDDKLRPSADVQKLALYGYDMRDVTAAIKAFQVHFLPQLVKTPFFGHVTQHTEQVLNNLQEQINEQV